MQKNAKDITNGVKYIMDVLSQVNNHFTEQLSPFYNLPRFIYRGITKFYPYDYIEGDLPKSPSEESVMNDYIRSGLSVKLQKDSLSKELCKEKIESTGYIRINYINTLEHLLINARKHYPEKYSANKSDLDVLADIQHNGGATCFVDFSKNILTALWFACNADYLDDGFIYCYDIMEDMIVNDALTYIKPSDEKKQIRSLLGQTYKETNISSDISQRFYLWEPFSNNSRIVRQDSIFMFGIEKFRVADHSIRLIRIPACQKPCILQAMRGLFNISAKTIYNDHIGFATSNSKNSLDNKPYESHYDKGYLDMIRGNFQSALNYFKLWEGSHKGNLSLEERLELSFSLAVSYKNIQLNEKVIDETIHDSERGFDYAENAFIEYGQVTQYARQILKRGNCDEKEREYYQRKCTRAYNGMMDMLYYMGRYQEGIKICDRIISDIEHGCLQKQKELITDEKTLPKGLNPKYCKIVKMELLNLHLLNTLETLDHLQSRERNLLKFWMESYYKDAISHPKRSHFDNLLIEYYKLIFDIIISKDSHITKEQKSHISEWREKFKNEKLTDKYDGYIIWNFKDIKDYIDEMDSQFEEKKKFLQYITAYIIAFRDEFEMQNWGRSHNV